MDSTPSTPTMDPSLGADRAGRVLSRRTLVSVGTGGARIVPSIANPVAPEAGPLELTPADLRQLERLSAVGVAGLDGAAEALVAALADRVLLVATTPDDVVDQVVQLEREGFDPHAVHLLHLPLVLRLVRGGFEFVDHDGTVRERFDARAVCVMRGFTTAGTFADARTRLDTVYVDDPTMAGAPVSDAELEAIGRRLWHAGVLDRVDQREAARQSDRRTSEYRQAIRKYHAFLAAVDAAYEPHAVEEQEREARTGVARTPVMPVVSSAYVLPLALGMVLASAREYDQGRLHESFDFHPRWLTRKKEISEAVERRSILLFSNYVWDHGLNLGLSADAKRSNPASLTIHGGPDTPKYRRDNDAYFAANDHVDVTVHGEGELTLSELLSALAPQVQDPDRDPAAPFDLSVLEDVPGLSFRSGDRIVHSAERDRIEEFDVAPSPFATDIFDAFATSGAVQMAILETNRGCPYGCTYCDWGSATASRIRKFPMDRIFEEIEWCARNKVPKLTIADANFGIWARDVEIAQKVADYKAEYGYPQWFATNYAKNTVKHLRQIVQVMLDAGIHTEGLLSLQSMDGATLEVIRRSNIKLEKYESLAREFRKHDMPLFVDLMLGLPGQTVQAFSNDLQECTNREVTAKVFPTQMLVNSPMNDPEYRTQYKIQTDNPDPTARAGTNHKAMVVSSSSFTQEDYNRMLLLRRAFLVTENYGVLRQVSRFVRQETGTPEITLLAGMLDDAIAEPERWPYLNVVLLATPDAMTPPASWALFIDELGQYLRERLAVADDDALATVLAVQHLLLPSRGRTFPTKVELPHDYAAWHAAVLAAKDLQHFDDWMAEVPRLASYGPGTFEVDDPHRLCSTNFGFSVDGSAYNDWELQSPVARPMPAEYDIDL